MSPDEARLRLLEHKISQSIPGFRLGWKDKSRGQKVIGALMFWNHAYMTNYVSTFYPVVYWPSEGDYTSDPKGSFRTLAHEYVHLHDAKRGNGWFAFSYMLPVWFVLFALLSVMAVWMSNWWLMALCALVFGAPIPAYWRMRWELRGYTMTMAVEAWERGSVSDSAVEWIIKQFTGPSYYFMWPFRSGMRRRLEKQQKAIHSGDVLVGGPPFQHVKEIMDASDVVVVEAAKRLK